MLPVVFYTGTRRWESLGRLLDLIDLGDEFEAVIPALNPLFLNLAGVPAKKLETIGGFGWVLRLIQERHTRRAEFQDVFRHAVEHLETMAAPERRRWFELLSYVPPLSIMQGTGQNTPTCGSKSRHPCGPIIARRYPLWEKRLPKT